MRPMPSDQPRQTEAEFETTNWTLIVQGGRDAGATGRFIGAYWSPIYAYIRRSGRDPHDAADLTQEFLTRVVLERGLLAKADEARGRFRSYLLTALKRFLIDDARARRRSGEASVRYLPDDPAQWQAVEPRTEADPGEAFERQWAAAVLAETMTRLERACRAEGLEQHWELFQRRVVDPALRPVEAPGRSELGPGDPQQVSNMIRTVKRKFDRIFRQVVGETVDRRDEVDAEIDLLRKLLE
jgi:DNA-directed RNA polymerase specialized sigma24 family protein